MFCSTIDNYFGLQAYYSFIMEKNRVLMNDYSPKHASPSSETSGESFMTAKDASSPADSPLFREGSFSRPPMIESNEGLRITASKKSDESEEDRASPTSVAVDFQNEVSNAERKDKDTKTKDEPDNVLIDKMNDMEETLLAYKREIADLNKQLETANQDKVELQQQVETSQAQRAKAIANLKNRKALLAQLTEKNRDLQTQLDQAQTKQEKLDDENASLRCGLQKLSANREDLKNKLRTKQEIVKSVRGEKDDVLKRLQKMKQEREMERELLNLYRDLARYTGYYSFGKQIRVLEADLAASLEE